MTRSSDSRRYERKLGSSNVVRRLAPLGGAVLLARPAVLAVERMQVAVIGFARVRDVTRRRRDVDDRAHEDDWS
jgi:hypothetical protein